MPLYEYKCNSCGNRFEVIQKFSDAPLTVHENCGGAVERLISAPGLQFKGTGWYVTDYGKGGSKPASSKSEGSNGSSSGSSTESSGKSESKPSTPAPAKSE
jgi:putative FmdB family regulatory protein